ncbi:TetR/AcrR family transcriptional regulator [Acidocella sp. MX-AZ03]|uniref:TetR/AcrR family transcriptional regulator n=1 Tax=Acidocella sp. MX-AZ03 TaxID=2697363 RepID=UPI0022DE6358|nr:TetR/AcrR family transcriptional regulator [Acidocella sp. MX-AZ03]WBO59908.1 TetR/AcrR family transcriptional regulator [Acidocella sp. MX-AZ03]
MLRAAVRMFNERGYHTTSLDDVAASLGISKPLIYHYLGAKEQVLFECLRLGISRLREAVRQAEALQGNGLERLKLFLCIYAQVIMDDFGRCVIRTGDEVLAPESRAQFRALKREIDEALRRFLQAASDDGSARISDVKLTAFGLAGALNWTARWQEAEGDLPPEPLAAKLVDILLRGIEPRG